MDCKGDQADAGVPLAATEFGDSVGSSPNSVSAIGLLPFFQST